MHLPNTVLLSAAIVLASYLEPLQAHLLGGDETDVLVGRFLRSDTTSGTHNEERTVREGVASLKRLLVKSFSAPTAAGAAKKAMPDATDIDNEKILLALDDLYKNLEALMKENGINSIDKLLSNPAVYQKLKDAVTLKNKEEGNKFSFRPIQLLLHHFKDDEVRLAIRKAGMSTNGDVKTIGKQLEGHLVTEDLVKNVSNGFIKKP